MDLQTTYLGLKLKNPLVPSASPLSRDLDGIKQLEDCGASAVVMFSLFEEQIVNESLAIDHFMEFGTDSYAEALSFLPEPARYHTEPDQYLDLIQKAKASVDIPVIASLNGYTIGGWTKFAKLMEEAGADALELNIYFVAADPDTSGVEVERRYRQIVTAVTEQVSIPVSVKLSPFFSSISNMARTISLSGAKGLVLFNRFYEPDFDLDNLEVRPRLTLSSSTDLRLPLHWTAILYGRVGADLAITGGVHNHLDVVKAIMAGANVTMLAAELLKSGVDRLVEIERELRGWMAAYDYESVTQMRGAMSYIHVADPGMYERANYMKELQSFRHDPTGIQPH